MISSRSPSEGFAKKPGAKCLHCSHFVKTPLLVLVFFFASVALFYDFLVFLLPVQICMSVAFGSKNLNSNSHLDLVTSV